jgi:pantoate kinase
MPASATAFAPGHISGLFAVHDEDPEPLRKGSRGAGWSLDVGATATVQRSPIAVLTVNGKPDAAPVTSAALADLSSEPLAVDIRLGLPTGQGFGMSAAGTLASCLAACTVLDLDAEDALAAAHRAEVNHGTGLGDAVGSWFGSGEVRIKPGIPPAGWAMRIEIPEGTGFLFCVLGKPIPTSSIIRDAEWKARTRQFGDIAVDRILEVGREKAWDRLLAESSVFTHRLGLLPPALAQLGAQMPEGTRWGQAMLGSTLWVAGAAGDLDRAQAVLEGTGQIIRCGPDRSGARLVRGP